MRDRYYITSKKNNKLYLISTLEIENIMKYILVINEGQCYYHNF